ncbi:MAG: CBS domain-containing protein [Gaiellaceae bacterium]
MHVLSDVMTKDVLAVEGDARLTQAAARMVARTVGAVVILEHDRLVGILTERDIMKAVASERANESRVNEWMTRHPEVVSPDDSTDHAAVLMLHGGFRHLPVVEGNRVVGIVSIRDLMRVAIADTSPRGA